MPTREQKIAILVKLYKGEINPNDLKPKRLCMAIGYSVQPIYMINEVKASEEEHWKLAKVQVEDTGTKACIVTYGNYEKFT